MVSVKTTLRNIANNTCSSHLILEKHIFSTSDCCRVFQAISNNTSQQPIQFLTIRGCRIDMDSLVAMLSKNNTLTVLTLWHIGLNDNDICILAKELSNNTVLKRLKINETFNNDSLLQLTLALSTNTCITTLDLSGCNIGDKDVYLITNMLSKNTTINVLSLECIEIGDKGVIELMSRQNNLTSLNLNYINISTEGIKLLTKQIMTNMCITNIFVDKTNQELQKLLARNVIHKKYKYSFDIPDELNNIIKHYVSDYCYHLF